MEHGGPTVAVVIVTFNHRDYIEACIRSVEENDPAQIVVVDTGSSDGTMELVRELFPEVTLIEPGKNIGYGAANNVGVSASKSDYVVVLNPDTVMEAGCLIRLTQSLQEQERSIAVPKILTYDGQSINTVGNQEHFTGLAFTSGYGASPSEYDRRMALSGVSGACFATSRELYERLGGFDESIFLYMEDVELSWRAHAEGIEICYQPSAVIRHDYPGLRLGAEKLYYLEFGRYYVLQKYYSITSRLVFLPSLVLTELLTWMYALSLGIAGLKSKVNALRAGRAQAIEDRRPLPPAVIAELDIQLPTDQLVSGPVGRIVLWFVNKIYAANVRLVRR